MQGTFSVLEKLGYTEWVKWRVAVGGEMNDEVADALNESQHGHKMRDCVGMLECPIDAHRARWHAHSAEYRSAHRATHPLPPTPKFVASNGVVDVDDL